MNVSKLIAGLRYELELVEASIQDFERLAEVRQPNEALTRVEIRLPTNGHPCKLCGKSGMESVLEGRLRPSSVDGVPSSATKKPSEQAGALAVGQ